MWVPSRKSMQATLVVAVFYAASACSPVTRVHGYAPDVSEQDLLIVGVDSQGSVEEAIGAPTTSGLREDRSWYFVESTVRTLAFWEPEVVARRVLVLDFDANGILEAKNQYGLDAGQVVNLQTRVTPTERRRRNILLRLLGNVGRITPPIPAG